MRILLVFLLLFLFVENTHAQSKNEDQEVLYGSNYFTDYFPLRNPHLIVAACKKRISAIASHRQYGLEASGLYYIKSKAEKELKQFKQALIDIDSASFFLNVIKKDTPNRFDVSLKLENDSEYVYRYTISLWSLQIDKTSLLISLSLNTEALQLINNVLPHTQRAKEKINSYYLMGQALANLSRFNEAIIACSKAISLDSAVNKGVNQNYDALNLRGYSQFKMGNFKSAIKDYDEAREYASMNERYYTPVYNYRAQASKGYSETDIRYTSVIDEKKKLFNMDSAVFSIFNDMVYVAGNTTVGSSTKIDAFYMAKHEVTQKQWKAIMNNNPSYHKCENCPVENISWLDAIIFIEKLNKITKGNYRLPTNIEWEYASDGGNATKGYIYSGGNDIDDVGWYRKNSSDSTHTIGQMKPNELGFYDMTGNVWEWCSNGPNGDAKMKFVKGGSYFYTANYCKANYVKADFASLSSILVGLRLTQVR